MIVFYADLKNKDVDMDRLCLWAGQSYTDQYNNSVRRDKSRLIGAALKHMMLDRFVSENVSLLKNQYGKEYIADSDMFLNISHSDDFACCCIHEKECGIDCERVDIKGNFLKVAKRFFTENEFETVRDSKDQCRTFSRLWTKKESYIKAIGMGFAKPLSEFNVGLDDGEVNGIFQKTFEISDMFVTCSGYDDFAVEFIDKTQDFIKK